MRLWMWSSALAAGVLCAGQALAQETQTYNYDVHGRLTGVTRTAGAAVRSTTYSLDNANNRTQRATSATAARALPDQASEPDRGASVAGSRVARAESGSTSSAASDSGGHHHLWCAAIPVRQGLLDPARGVQRGGAIRR